MRDRRFLLTAAASIMLLLFCVLASIACGSKSVGFPTVIRSLFHLGEETFENNVVQARIPRTVFGILAGASLSVSGALMQAVTRNPIADRSDLCRRCAACCSWNRRGQISGYVYLLLQKVSRACIC